MFKAPPFAYIPCLSLLERNMTTVEKRGTCRMLCRMLYALSISPVAEEQKVYMTWSWLLQVTLANGPPFPLWKKKLQSESHSRGNGCEQEADAALDMQSPLFCIAWGSAVLNCTVLAENSQKRRRNKQRKTHQKNLHTPQHIKYSLQVTEKSVSFQNGTVTEWRQVGGYHSQKTLHCCQVTSVVFTA